MKLDKFSYHEAITLTFVLANIIEDYIQNNPVLNKHKKIQAKVIKAIDLLGEVYQDICEKSDKKFE